MTVQLVDEGRPRAQLVVPDGSLPAVSRAAAVVADAVARVTGTTLPVVARPRPDLPHAIRFDPTLAGPADAVAVRAAGDELVVAGGSPAAVVDAATVLIEQLGVRSLAPDCVVHPSSRSLVVPTLDVRHAPAFGYRDVFADAATDPTWAAANRLNGWVTSPGDDRGHGAGWAWPPFHTFAWLLPAGRHFRESPDVFTLVDGQRRPSQFCLSSPRTLELVTERVLAWMERTPDQRFYSMTQNDNNDMCHCAECTRLTDTHGSPQGPLLRFVNGVGEAVAARFPDKQLVTFAYAWTLQPPTGLAPGPNVWVQVCALTDPGTLVSTLAGWRALTDRLLVWEYFTGFTHYVVPNPTLHRSANDLRYYRDHGVSGVFAQVAYQSPGADLAELRSYVLAQLLWDPDQSVDALVDAFLPAYYGDAAPMLAEYIDVSSAALRRVGYGNSAAYELAELVGAQDPSLQPVTGTWWVAPARGAWLNDGALDTYAALFDAAEKAVADDEVRLRRVERSRLPVDAVAVTAALRRGTADPGRLGRVVEVAAREGVTRWGEWTFFDEWVAEALGWDERTGDTPPLDADQLAAYEGDGYVVLPHALGIDLPLVAGEMARICRGEWDCLGAGLAPLPPDTSDSDAVDTLPSLNLPHQLSLPTWRQVTGPQPLALARQVLGTTGHPVFSRVHNRTAGAPPVEVARSTGVPLWMSPWTGRFESPAPSFGVWIPLTDDAAREPLLVVPGSHLTDDGGAPVEAVVPAGGSVVLHERTRWGLPPTSSPRTASSLIVHYAAATGVPPLEPV